jgi:hypothetical protein
MAVDLADLDRELSVKRVGPAARRVSDELCGLIQRQVLLCVRRLLQVVSGREESGPTSFRAELAQERKQAGAIGTDDMPDEDLPPVAQAHKFAPGISGHWR